MKTGKEIKKYKESKTVQKKAVGVKAIMPPGSGINFSQDKKSNTGTVNTVQLAAESINHSLLQKISDTAKAKSINSDASTVQLAKFSELGAQQGIVGAAAGRRFAAFLKTNISEFSALPVNNIITAVITQDTDYPNLAAWITGFLQAQQQSQQEQQAQSSSSGSARMQERALPASVTHDGAHVSFSTNIQSGINGMFNLWFYQRLNILDVDVKFQIPSGASPAIGATLQAIEHFWTNKFRLREKTTGRTIRVDVNIIPTQGEDFHYRYADLTGSSANPNVSRAGQQFSARDAAYDRTQGQQISAFHEFGHAIGLGEEYGLPTHERGHHFEALREQRAAIPTVRPNGTVEGSIMGQDHAVQQQHYTMVLQEFCTLTHQRPADWEIIK